MIEYKMRKLGDGMLGDPEKHYPKVVSHGVVTLDELAQLIQQRTTFTTADVAGMIVALKQVIAEACAQGRTVKIDGLGLFKPMLGLVSKEERRAWTNSAGRLTTSHNVKLKTVGFKADNDLVREVGRSLELKRMGGLSEGTKPQTTVDERAEMARQYLARKGYMHVRQYAQLTGLDYTAAINELKLLVADAANGITTEGRGPAKVYVLRTSADE